MSIEGSAYDSGDTLRGCWFDPALYGSWLLHEHGGTKEHVSIDRHQVSFTLKGNYSCLQVLDKTKHRYLTVSTFTNGWYVTER